MSRSERESGLRNGWVVLRKVLRVWEFLGRWCPRKELPRERLSGAREGDLLACLVVCFGRSWWCGTCIVILVEIKIQPLQMPPPPPSLSSKERRRGADYLSFSLKVVASFVLWTLLEVEVGKDTWQINDRDPDVMMNEIVWQRQSTSG